MSRQHEVRPPSKGLTLTREAQQLRFLEKKRSRLEKRIRRTRRIITESAEYYQLVVTETRREAGMIIERCQQLDREIHGLFADIFRTRKFGKRSQRQIERIYRELQDEGVLSARGSHLSSRPAERVDNDGFPKDDEPKSDDQGGEEGPHRYEHSWDESTHQRSRDLRDLFLRLAGVFHPDLTDDADKQREHTEIMKKLTRAYREGDAAGLFAMERELDKQPTAGASNDSDHRARLESQIRLLQAQLAKLETALSELRNSELGRMIESIRASALFGSRDPIEFLVTQFTDEVNILQETRDFVTLFRDRKLTIADFVRGPTQFHDDIDIIEDVMADLVSMVAAEWAESQPKRKRKRARKSRKRRK